MSVKYSYTDLAKELKTGCVPDGSGICRLSSDGSFAPKGDYVTLEAPEGEDKETAEKLAAEIASMLPAKKEGPLLLVGLGNPLSTPDSLGPEVIKKVAVTNHLDDLTGGRVLKAAAVNAPVEGRSGIKSFDFIKAVSDLISPCAVILIDSLAARSYKSLGRVIQLSSAGITPGSGAGAHGFSLSEETLSRPVLWAGAPTVVRGEVFAAEMAREMGLSPGTLSDTAAALSLTPVNIDRLISRMAAIIASALNRVILAGS